MLNHKKPQNYIKQSMALHVPLFNNFLFHSFQKKPKPYYFYFFFVYVFYFFFFLAFLRKAKRHEHTQKILRLVGWVCSDVV